MVQIPTILPPLLYTKKSQSVCALFTRYLDTLLYVKDWTTTDIFDPETVGYKSLGKVKAMHRHINKVMNVTAEEHSKPSKVAPTVWVSQYDMVVTQWAFYGLHLMHPKACALYHITDDELYEIVYSWRVISYFIGIDDRFSLWSDNLEKTQQLCHLLFEEVYRPILENQDRSSVGSRMADDIFTSMAPVIGSFTSQVANKYWFDILGIKSEVVLDTWYETFVYNLLKFAFHGILKLNFVYSMLNSYLTRDTDKQAKPEIRQKNLEKLTETPKNSEVHYVFDDNVF